MKTPNRRDFLATASAALLGTLAAGRPRVLSAAADAEGKEEKLTATADTVVVLWMAGGMAHTETFDPKRYTPFEKGLESNRVLSTFPSIPTAVDTIHISQGLEQIASVLDRGTLIRTHVAGDMGKILHSRHQYHWHTGYEPPQTVAAPHSAPGSRTPRARGTRPCRPSSTSASATTATARRRSSRRFKRAAALGSQYGPFRVPDPEQAVLSVRPPAGMSEKRFRRRFETYKKLLSESPIAKHGSDYQRESLLQSLENAHRLMNCAGRQGVRPLARAAKELRHLQHRAFRPGLPARPAACRGRGAVHRGLDRVRPVPRLGHARQRPHADDCPQADDRRPDCPVHPRP